jgi:hypothetical protein
MVCAKASIPIAFANTSSGNRSNNKAATVAAVFAEAAAP